jgi:AraC-like DNA-binding protein
MPDATTTASWAQQMLHFAASRGMRPDRLLAEAGLPADLLSLGPDARMPYEGQVALWEAVAAHPSVGAFGLDMGRQHFQMAYLGVVGHLLSTCSTLGEGLEVMGRYRALVSDALFPHAALEGGRLRLWSRFEPRLARLRHVADAMTATAVYGLSGLAGRPLRPREVRLQHPAPADLRPYAETFGPACALAFGCPESEVVFDGAVVALPLPSSNPPALEYLERHARELLARLPRSAQVATRVRQVLSEQLRHGEPGKARVAKVLGMSERTLHRRLEEEGASFTGLLDELRRELAVLYLGEPRLAVYEVALLLGYSEPSAFFRAFKRWTGRTPQEHREGLAPRA